MLQILVSMFLFLSACNLSFSSERLQADTVLILLVDVSGSITDARYDIQRQGVINAFRTQKFKNTLMAGEHRRIIVNYIEWADDIKEHGWFIIEEHTIQNFITHLENTTRPFRGGTSLRRALQYTNNLLNELPFDAERIVIDVSGDGEDSSAVDITEQGPRININDYNTRIYRDQILARGVTINGIIMIDQLNTSLEEYYRENIIGGPGSFLLSVEDDKEFGEIFLLKIVRELS